MKAKPIIPRKIANQDIDDAISYYLSEATEQAALGFIGALLGRWIATQLGISEIFNLRIGTHSFPIIWSIIGAALFVAVLSLVSRGSRD